MGADKILPKKNSAYVPKSLPKASLFSCQDHVTTELSLTLGARHQPVAVEHTAEKQLEHHTTDTGQTGHLHRSNQSVPDHPELVSGSPERNQGRTGSPKHQSRIT